MKGSSSKEIEYKFNEIKEMYLKNRQKQVEIGHNVEERLRGNGSLSASLKGVNVIGCREKIELFIFAKKASSRSIVSELISFF